MIRAIAWVVWRWYKFKNNLDNGVYDTQLKTLTIMARILVILFTVMILSHLFG